MLCPTAFPGAVAVREPPKSQKNRGAARAVPESEASLAVRLAELTPRERQVMDRVLLGDYNKTIADLLGIAVRTVEVHRARIFEKMGVRSAVELAQLLATKR